MSSGRSQIDILLSAARRNVIWNEETSEELIEQEASDVLSELPRDPYRHQQSWQPEEYFSLIESKEEELEVQMKPLVSSSYADIQPGQSIESIPIDYLQYHKVVPIPAYQAPGTPLSKPVKEDKKLEWSKAAYKESWRRRHWKLADQCLTLLLPTSVPENASSSVQSRYLSLRHGDVPVGTAEKPTTQLKQSKDVKDIPRCYKGILNARFNSSSRMVSMQLPDGLLQLRWLDSWTRRQIVKGLENFLGGDQGVSMASLENATMTVPEGGRVLRALAANSAKTLSELYLWRAFEPGQNPITDSQGRDFLTVLQLLSHLRLLAINYGYLADDDGSALLNLQCVQRGNLQELQLLCLYADTPGRPRIDVVWKTEDKHNMAIPHHAWVQLKKLCPKLTISTVLLAVCYYEDITAFLDEEMAMKSLLISTGTEQKRRSAWKLPLTLSTITSWYRATLEELTLQLWRGAETVDAELASLATQLPRLRIFDFRGPVDHLESVRNLLNSVVNTSNSMTSVKMEFLESLAAPPKANFKQEVAALGREYTIPCLQKNIFLQLSVSGL